MQIKHFRFYLYYKIKVENTHRFKRKKIVYCSYNKCLMIIYNFLIEYKQPDEHLSNTQWRLLGSE